MSNQCVREMEEQLYPIGSQTFEKIRKNRKVYIDKTALIYNLVNKYEYVFLARPRRFGKSLLLSTLQAYFEGKKDLFEGLAIYELEKEWRKYPVFHLKLSGTESNNVESLPSELNRQFSRWERQYDLPTGSEIYSSRFRELITGVYEKTEMPVVILIDEYDNPLINSLYNNELHERFKDLLKSVYSSMKDLDEYIKFAMITGVSRFSKTSIFSGLNNITDISFEDEYSSICGFTLDEIKKYLWPGVEKLASEMELTKEATLMALKTQYDGYHFSKKCPDLYNPFSLLNALAKKEIGDYWISSGTPEFLVKTLAKTDKDFNQLFESCSNESRLGTNDVALFSPVALMYQTGYLTIKSYDREDRIYKLGVPNKEVNFGLFTALLAHYTREDGFESLLKAKALKKALLEGRPEEFMERLKSFFAEIPFSLNPDRYELNFEKVLYSILRLLDLDVRSEVQTSDGRIDVLIKTDKYIYILELKLDKPAQEALEQIDRKDYSLQFKFDNKKIFKIGISYSSETRNIAEWEIKVD